MYSTHSVYMIGVPANLASTANMSVSSANANFPTSNLANERISERWWSTGESATIEVDLGSTAGGEVGGFYLVNHNLTTQATITFEGDNSTGYASGELTKTTGITAWASSAAAAAGYIGGLGYASTEGNLSRRYWRITITNTGGGTVKAGHLGLGKVWSPNYGVAVNAHLMVHSLDVVQQTEQGAVFGDIRPAQREVMATIHAMTWDEGLEQYVGDLLRRHGLARGLWVRVAPGKNYAHHLGFFARRIEVGDVTFGTATDAPLAGTLNLLEIPA